MSWYVHVLSESVIQYLSFQEIAVAVCVMAVDEARPVHELFMNYVTQIE